MAIANISPSKIPSKKFLSLEDYDIAFAKVKFVKAMMTAITGDGFDHFSSMSEPMQHDYLYAVASMVDVLEEAIIQGNSDE